MSICLSTQFCFQKFIPILMIHVPQTRFMFLYICKTLVGSILLSRIQNNSSKYIFQKWLDLVFRFTDRAHKCKLHLMSSNSIQWYWKQLHCLNEDKDNDDVSGKATLLLSSFYVYTNCMPWNCCYVRLD